MTNQVVIRDFLKTTMDIVAEKTSRNYSIVAINGLKEELGEEFKFSKNIHIKDKSIKVDKTINSVSNKELRKFFTRIINWVGPNYLKLLLVQKLNTKELEYLEYIGLKFG